MENICLPFHLFTYRRSVSRWLPTREQPNDEISFRDAFPRLAKLKASAPPVRFGQDIGRPPYFRYPRPNASDRERERIGVTFTRWQKSAIIPGIVVTGGAVITVPPMNQTKLEGEKVQFNCEAKALPGNVTVRWFREGSPVTELSELDTRVTIKSDGSLVINPVSADDSGQYLCEVTNGIGDPQSASAYLNVECELYSNCSKCKQARERE